MLTLSFATTSTAAPGDLDPNFGDGGMSAPIVEGSAAALARQSDGKLVVVGNGNGQNLVARFTVNGGLDPTFSGDGWTTLGFQGAHWATAIAVAVQPDGKIVVGGTVSPSGGDSRMALARLNHDGSPDATFSGDGQVVATRLGDWSDEMASLLIQSDGKILAIGRTPWSAWRAMRFEANGEVDTSFGSSGTMIDAVNFSNNCTIAALQPDGRILLAGTVGLGTTHQGQFAVLRLNPNGSKDGSFGGNGWAFCDFGAGGSGEASGIYLQPDGRIVLSGYFAPTSGNVCVVMRMMPDGGLDTSFSGDGKLRLPRESFPDNGVDWNGFGCVCTGRPDGKLLLGGGIRRITGGYDWCILRLTPEGELDHTFANAGFAIAPDRSPGYFIRGMITQPDGKTVTAMGDGWIRAARFISDTDTDSDGVDDPTEVAAGTNPSNPDTDGDGLSDGEELAEYFTNPFDTDTDKDGLGDGDEVHVYRANPLLPDTDGDGLSDFTEVTISHTNPNRADSDGDGLSDRDEIDIHHTDPRNPDTDGDEIEDGSEIQQHGSNPLVPDTDGDGFLDGYEVQTGKSPTDPADKPALVAEARTAIEFTFPSAIGKTYRIEDSLDLVTWSTVEAGIAGNGGVIQRFYATRGQPKRYFRVEEQVP